MTLRTCAHQIVDGLWVSAMPAPDWDLDGWGVRLVVTLSEHLPPQAARRFAWATAGGAAGEGRILFVHWPIEDGPIPAWDTCAVVVGTVVDAVGRGWPVLIHCQEGRNRSGLIAALAVRELTGSTGAAAADVVRAARPGMLYNKAFAAALGGLGAPGPVPPELPGVPHLST